MVTFMRNGAKLDMRMVPRAVAMTDNHRAITSMSNNDTREKPKKVKVYFVGKPKRHRKYSEILFQDTHNKVLMSLCGMLLCRNYGL